MLPEGEYEVKATIKRKSQTGEGKSFKLIIDNASPQIKLNDDNLINGVHRTNKSDVVIDGTVIDRSPFKMKYIVDPLDKTNPWTTLSLMENETKMPIQLKNMAEGIHNVYILAEETAIKRVFSIL